MWCVWGVVCGGCVVCDVCGVCCVWCVMRAVYIVWWGMWCVWGVWCTCGHIPGCSAFYFLRPLHAVFCSLADIPTSSAQWFQRLHILTYIYLLSFEVGSHCAAQAGVRQCA